MIVTFVKPSWVGPEEGLPHYQPGYVVDVPDTEARRLIAAGSVVIGRVELPLETKSPDATETTETAEANEDTPEADGGKGNKRVHSFGRGRARRDIS